MNRAALAPGQEEQALRFAKKAESMGFNVRYLLTEQAAEVRAALAVDSNTEGGPTMVTTRDRAAGPLTLAEADSLEAEVFRFAESRGEDATDPAVYGRLVNIVSARPHWNSRIAEAYRSPLERRDDDAARFAEQADALNRAVEVVGRERGLDVSNAVDRAVALTECASDPRFKHLCGDYSRSSIGRDGRSAA